MNEIDWIDSPDCSCCKVAKVGDLILKAVSTADGKFAAILMVPPATQLGSLDDAKEAARALAERWHRSAS